MYTFDRYQPAVDVVAEVFQLGIVLESGESNVNFRDTTADQQRIDDQKSLRRFFAFDAGILVRRRRYCRRRIPRVGQLRQVLSNERVKGQPEAVDHVLRRLAKVVHQIRIFLFQRNEIHDVAAKGTASAVD